MDPSEPKRVPPERRTPSEPGESRPAIAEALRALSTDELALLRRVATRLARGLPGTLGGADLLNEAVLRALCGSRHRPPDLPLPVFLAGVMRSVGNEHRRAAHRHGEAVVSLDDDGADDREAALQAAGGDVDPERSLAATQELAAIRQGFADDPAAIGIVEGLAEGWSPAEIRARLGLGEVDYDSARRRIRRALIRWGMV